MKKQAIIAALTGATGFSQAASTAISGTGWNEDLVIENTTNWDWAAVPGALTTGRVAGWAFYESGWGDAPQGLNNTGAYTGPSGSSYQLESYTSNNAILNTGTFTPSAGASYSEIAFLTTTQDNGGGNITWEATLNFADTTSTVLSGNGIDWTNGAASEVVSSNHGLANDSNQAFYGDTLSIVERTFTLSAADQGKTLTSIDLARTGGTNVVFHAISGQAVPEPSSALLSLLALGFMARRRR